MSYEEINIRQVKENLVSLVADRWMLVAAGGPESYNMMTASWGGFGEMWGTDVALTVIRPSRYTGEFVQRNDRFTLSFFDEDQKAIHGVCGNKSGRDVDKATLTGLTPVFDHDTVRFKQARLTVVCRKLYVQRLEEDCFTDHSLLPAWYGGDKGGLHIAFVGKVETVLRCK